MLEIFLALKAKAEEFGRQSAQNEFAGLNSAELAHNCRYRVDQLKKQRLWISIVLLLVGISQCGQFEMSFSGIVMPILIAVAAFSACFLYFVWVSQKIIAYQFTGRTLAVQVAKDPDAKRAFEAENAVLQSEIAVQREAQKIADLRRDLRVAHWAVGQHEAKGEYAKAGEARGRAAEIESRLRATGN